MQKTIFMVDDNVSNLAKVEEFLEEHFLVITLSSSSAMFAVLEKVIPNLILLDIDMPDMDGFETIKLLKCNERYADIPVIFLTGFTDSDTEAYGIELGAVDFITKPFSEPVFLRRIENQLHIDELIHKKTERGDKYMETLQTLLKERRFEGFWERGKENDSALYREAVTVIEALELLTAQRPHKREFNFGDAAALLSSDTGGHFDAPLLRFILQHKERFK